MYAILMYAINHIHSLSELLMSEHWLTVADLLEQFPWTSKEFKPYVGE